MPDAAGNFKGAAYPHIPWETEADRRRARVNQRRAELLMEQHVRDSQSQHLRDLRARHPQSELPAPVGSAVRQVATHATKPAKANRA